MIAALIAAGVLIAACFTLARLFAGPTFHDRALAATGLNAKLALVIAAVGAMSGRPGLIDQALIQLGLGFVMAVAVLKVLRLRSLQPALDHGPKDQGVSPEEGRP